MEEVKKDNIQPVKKETNTKPLVEEIKELKEFKQQVMSEGVKKKKIKIPRKAKVRKRKLKKGWVGILKIDENRNISGERQKVSGNAYVTNDGTYHAMKGDELFFFEGKYPLVVQPSWRTNPLRINMSDEKNETFGDKYKMAKMLNDTIKVKKKGGNIIIWILLGGVALFGINYLMGGGLFG